MYKLIAFRWLWPYSKNYDAELMQDMVFDDYMERALQRDLNKLTRAKLDTSVVREALRVVREFIDQKAIAKLDLKSAAETTMDCDTFQDASACIDIAEVEVCVTSSSICAYLPPSCDPTYQYAECGFIVFKDSVCTSATSDCGKGMHTRSDAILSALRVSGEAAFKATQALRQAQAAQQLYYGACAASFALHDIPHCKDKSEKLVDELQSIVCRHHSGFRDSVHCAARITKNYVAQYEKLRQVAQSSVRTSSHSQCAIDDIAKLCQLRDNSKMFSSDKWICVLLNQL